MGTLDSKTVLLIEDSFDTRAIYATMLRHYGYRVLEAGDGSQGIQVARDERPDLILMNISLPLIDGWTATAVLKADPLTAAIPVIALTAFIRPTDKARARAAGCDGYLDKPVEPTRVLDEVRRWIGEPPASLPGGSPGGLPGGKPGEMPGANAGGLGGLPPGAD